jgi:hypothetical protein
MQLTKHFPPSIGFLLPRDGDACGIQDKCVTYRHRDCEIEGIVDNGSNESQVFISWALLSESRATAFFKREEEGSQGIGELNANERGNLNFWDCRAYTRHQCASVCSLCGLRGEGGGGMEGEAQAGSQSRL